jgi:hypothetical protein
MWAIIKTADKLMKSYSIFQYCFNTSTLVYRTLNSRSKYKCFQVYRQKEIKLYPYRNYAKYC